MIRFGIIIGGLVAVFGCTAHAAPTDTLERCKKAAAFYKEAYNKGDAATIASVYTDDAVASNANWTATGRAAIQKAMAADMANGSRFTSITCEYSNSIGVANGSWSGTAKGPDGKEMTIGGHWLNFGPWVKPDDPNDLRFTLQRSFVTMQMPQAK